MRGIRFVAIAVSVCAVLGSIVPGAAKTVGLPAQPAAPLPRVAPFFGAAPQNCPIASSRVIHYYRGAYIWVGSGALRGNSGWYIANHQLALGFGFRTKYGYPQKIFWQLINGSTGPVSLTGWNLRTRQRIWFGRPTPQANPQSTAPPPVIAWPAGLIRQHQAPTLTFVPSAGCYVIHATWHGGQWTIPFVAGG